MTENYPNTPNLSDHKRHLLSVKDALKPTEDPATGNKIDLVFDAFSSMSSSRKIFFDYRPFETVLTPDVLPVFIDFLNKLGLEASIPDESRLLIQFDFRMQENPTISRSKAVAAARVGLEKIIDTLVNSS